jgi:hypothetical protein
MAERVGFEPTVRVSAHLISNQDRSTTPAPLHMVSNFKLGTYGASTPDLTRIASRRSSPLRGACGVQNAFAFCDSSLCSSPFGRTSCVLIGFADWSNQDR